MQAIHVDAITSDARGHFRIYYYAALLILLRKVQTALGSYQRAVEIFPFLEGYYEQFTPFLDENGQLPDDIEWQQLVAEWELNIHQHLPLRAIRETAELAYHDAVIWMLIGLPEADGRFGILFETLQGVTGQTRLTLGLLMTWFDETIYNSIHRIIALGLIHLANTQAVRPEWILQMSPVLWDVLLDTNTLLRKANVSYVPHSALPHTHALIIPDTLKRRIDSLIPLFADGHLDSVIVRGLHHNGRRHLLMSIAQALGRNVLVFDNPPLAQDDYWREIGALATALRAMPIFICDIEPTQVRTMPKLSCYRGGIGIVIGQTGGVTGEGVARAVMLTLPLPSVAERSILWQRTMHQQTLADVEVIARQLRITRGHIERISEIALSYARLDNRTTLTMRDIQQANQALNHHSLDLLATRMEPLGTWDDLIVEQRTLSELQTLEKRCRHRENLIGSLNGALSGSLNAGVRALMQGPSGTGKTMSARILAAELNKDLYRVDLASVVNKYIGETEKNLNQVLSRAEELDIILLLDEGDALLTRRTHVQSANDRYANLETNYLLQRLEAYEGILLITTNAADHIDSAFERRMDVVINFTTPAAAERLAIWERHLPSSHQVDERLLRDVARRCQLAGGQIRNAVLHATLLSLDEQQALQSEHLKQGVLREYEKAGELCPLSFD